MVYTATSCPFSSPEPFLLEPSSPASLQASLPRISPPIMLAFSLILHFSLGVLRLLLDLVFFPSALGTVPGTLGLVPADLLGSPSLASPFFLARTSRCKDFLYGFHSAILIPSIKSTFVRFAIQFIRPSILRDAYSKRELIWNSPTK